MLVGAGVSADARDYDEKSALYCAVAAGYPRVARCLLDCGASVGLQDGSGEFPLSFAMAEGLDDVAAPLVEAELAAGW